MRPDFLIMIANEKPPKRKKRKGVDPRIRPPKSEPSKFLDNGLTPKQNDEMTKKMLKRYREMGQFFAKEI